MTASTEPAALSPAPLTVEDPRNMPDDVVPLPPTAKPQREESVIDRPLRLRTSPADLLRCDG